MPITEQRAESIQFAPPAELETDIRDAEPAAPKPHHVFRRLTERFALIAFGLYHLPLFLNNYPSLGGGGGSDKGVALSWGHVFTAPGIWVARHVFGITGPMPNGTRGDNGDVAEEFARLLLAVAIAMVVAACWTIADRRRPRSRWAGDALRVLLRYSIALGLASYALAKILPVQFVPPSTFALEQRVGDLTPMALLWTFMGYSRSYAFFGGVMELAVVLLLCFRRTATLGAVLCIAVMTNVSWMNYAYGVPVKLYATMTVLSAMVIVLYDAPRLIALFVSNTTAPPAQLSALPQDHIPTRARWAIKFLLVGSVLLSSVVPMAQIPGTRSGTGPFDGLWVVTSFTRDGRASNDLTRWKTLTVRGSLFGLRFASDSLLRCRSSASPTSRTLPLACAQDRRGELRVTRSGDTLQLDGAFDATRVTASARLVKPSDYRLMQSKFRWIIE